MKWLWERARARILRGLERERPLERYIRVVSRFIWPWQDAWLVPLAALLASLDLVSTYILLELSGKVGIEEGGLLASWVLRRSGYEGLYIMNAVVVGSLCLLATGTRLFYSRFGLGGFARTAYVVALVPYVVAALAAVVNNVVLIIL